MAGGGETVVIKHRSMFGFIVRSKPGVHLLPLQTHYTTRADRDALTVLIEFVCVCVGSGLGGG